MDGFPSARSGRPGRVQGEMESFRGKLGQIIDSTWSQRFIVAVLLVNAVTLGVETSPWLMGSYGPVIMTINDVIPIIFVVEVGTRLIARGPRFFREAWNVFDVIIISVSFLPSGQAFAALRALRILRILHVISVVPRMRHVVASMLRSIPQISSILALLLILTYISGVITTHLFGADYPEQFGGIGTSMLTLFQLMTLEGWAGDVVRPVMEKYPYSVLFFIPYMLATAFAILNLFTAVLVDSMQIIQQNYTYERTEENIHHIVQDELVQVKSDLSALRSDIRGLREDLAARAGERE